jgi:hypothetical protein
VARLGRYKLWIVVAIVLFVIGVVLPLMFYGSGSGTSGTGTAFP